jgi:hypothetical protein
VSNTVKSVKPLARDVWSIARNNMTSGNTRLAYPWENRSGSVVDITDMQGNKAIDRTMKFLGDAKSSSNDFVIYPEDIVFGHPAIGKTFSIRDGKLKDRFIDWDDEFNSVRDKWIEQHSGTKKGTLEFKDARNEYLINYKDHPEYIEFVKSKWNAAKEKAKQEGKTLIASPAMLVELFPKDFTKAIMLSKYDFIKRNT